MDDTTKMVALLRRLKTEMNGAVVGAMQDRGVDYPLSYGVSVATIREIAAGYAPDHSLALLLFRQQVRELRLAAAFIDDPESVTSRQMDEWAEAFDRAEIVEQVVWALFRRVRHTAQIALAWMESDRPMKRYAGLLTAASSLDEDWCGGMPEAFFEAIVRMGREGELPAAVCRGVVRLLLRLSATSADWRRRTKELLAVYAASEDTSLRYIAEEADWQIEYTEDVR